MTSRTAAQGSTSSSRRGRTPGGLGALATCIASGVGWSKQTQFHRPESDKGTSLQPEALAKPPRCPATQSWKRGGGVGVGWAGSDFKPSPARGPPRALFVQDHLLTRTRDPRTFSFRLSLRSLMETSGKLCVRLMLPAAGGLGRGTAPSTSTDRALSGAVQEPQAPLRGRCSQFCVAGK